MENESPISGSRGCMECIPYIDSRIPGIKLIHTSYVYDSKIYICKKCKSFFQIKNDKKTYMTPEEIKYTYNFSVNQLKNSRTTKGIIAFMIANSIIIIGLAIITREAALLSALAINVFSFLPLANKS